MTRGGRAVVGAMVGAALTLLIHPASRPFAIGAFVAPAQHEERSQTKIPDNLVELSDWMQAVGDRYSAYHRPSTIELRNAIAAARHGADLDPRNAFWHQMLAALLHGLGKENEARHEWIVASNCDTWNDYQSQELLEERERLATDFGGPQSWQLAYVYFQRSQSAVQIIRTFAHSVLANAALDTKEGLTLRAANVLNGGLLREGSRKIDIGNLGAMMSEEACHPPGIDTAPNPHHNLFLARLTMYNRLKDFDQSILADRVNHIYRELDGWQALENAVEANDTVVEYSYLSLVYVGAGGMAIVMTFIGLAIGFIGRSSRKLERIKLPHALIAATTLGCGAFVVTRLPLAAFATFLCCLSLTLGPKRERRVKVDDLGPMFSFTIGALGLIFMLLLGTYIIGASAPAVSLLPHLNAPNEYFGGSGVLLGLAVIVLAVLLLLPPMFATALRVGTSFVLSLALRKFGAFLGYVSLALVVFGTPLCIYLDRQNARSLQRLVANEPVYYLSLPR